ncbi:MAG TPA: hypothetical protein VMR74_12655 [Gammaproteobacteria bacterium]|nr:hypothetical protein [Gammaproteobacteria bacterium]
MCEPVSLSTALMVASSTAAVYGQYQQAGAQTDALALQRQHQQEEIQAQADERAGERVKQARAERARLRVAAGEAGVSGISFEDQLYDTYLQEDLDLGILAKDSRFADRASDARYRSGLAGVNRPSVLGAGLQIAGAGYAGHSQGLQIKTPSRRVTDDAT